MPPINTPTGASGASLSDILTSIKNLVTGINAQTQNDNLLAGTSNFPSITAATMVKGSAGRLVNLFVTVAGSGSGTVYDSNSTTNTNIPVWTIPHSGVANYVLNIPVLYGIVIAPGSGQTVSGTFS